MKNFGLKSLFFLLSIDNQLNKKVYIFVKEYSEYRGIIPIRCIFDNKNNTKYYQFAINSSDGIWDEEKWSELYLEKNIPAKFRFDIIDDINDCINKYKADLDRILN